MKRILQLSESDLVGLVNKVIKENKKQKVDKFKTKFLYGESGSILIEFADSKYIKTILSQLPKNITFLAIMNSKFADFNGVNLCDYPKLQFVNLRGTENNLDEQNVDCFEKLSDFVWDRIEIVQPEPAIYRDDKTEKLPFSKGLSMNETLYEDVYGSVQSIDYNEEFINEAEYQGRKVQLGKIMQGDVKKSKVYVKNDKGKVVKVNFGFGGTSAKGKIMRIKKNDPERRKNFRARHNCENPGPRWKPRYWACRTW